MVVFRLNWFYSGKVVVSGQKWLLWDRVVVFGQKWLYSGIRAKLLYSYSGKFGQICYSWAKVVVFGQSGSSWEKWLYSGKVVVFGQRWLYSRKVVVFQSGYSKSAKNFFSGKVAKWLYAFSKWEQNSGKSCCIGAKWLYLGKSGKVVVNGESG